MNTEQIYERLIHYRQDEICSILDIDILELCHEFNISCVDIVEKFQDNIDEKLKGINNVL